MHFKVRRNAFLRYRNQEEEEVEKDEEAQEAEQEEQEEEEEEKKEEEEEQDARDLVHCEAVSGPECFLFCFVGDASQA